MKKIKKLKSYIIEFLEDGVMKPKVYPSNYVVRIEYYQPIIIITYNKYIFAANSGI